VYIYIEQNVFGLPHINPVLEWIVVHGLSILITVLEWNGVW
jgi:hypothetical protein